MDHFRMMHQRLQQLQMLLLLAGQHNQVVGGQLMALSRNIEEAARASEESALQLHHKGQQIRALEGAITELQSQNSNKASQIKAYKANETRRMTQHLTKPIRFLTPQMQRKRVKQAVELALGGKKKFCEDDLQVLINHLVTYFEHDEEAALERVVAEGGEGEDASYLRACIGRGGAKAAAKRRKLGSCRRTDITRRVNRIVNDPGVEAILIRSRKLRAKRASMIRVIHSWWNQKKHKMGVERANELFQSVAGGMQLMQQAEGPLHPGREVREEDVPNITWRYTQAVQKHLQEQNIPFPTVQTFQNIWEKHHVSHAYVEPGPFFTMLLTLIFTTPVLAENWVWFAGEPFQICTATFYDGFPYFSAAAACTALTFVFLNFLGSAQMPEYNFLLFLINASEGHYHSLTLARLMGRWIESCKKDGLEVVFDVKEDVVFPQTNTKIMEYQRAHRGKVNFSFNNIHGGDLKSIFLICGALSCNVRYLPVLIDRTLIGCLHPDQKILPEHMKSPEMMMADYDFAQELQNQLIPLLNAQLSALDAEYDDLRPLSDDQERAHERRRKNAVMSFRKKVNDQMASKKSSNTWVQPLLSLLDKWVDCTMHGMCIESLHWLQTLAVLASDRTISWELAQSFSTESHKSNTGSQYFGSGTASLPSVSKENSKVAPTTRLYEALLPCDTQLAQRYKNSHTPASRTGAGSDEALSPHPEDDPDGELANVPPLAFAAGEGRALRRTEAGARARAADVGNDQAGGGDGVEGSGGGTDNAGPRGRAAAPAPAHAGAGGDDVQGSGGTDNAGPRGRYAGGAVDGNPYSRQFFGPVDMGPCVEDSSGDEQKSGRKMLYNMSRCLGKQANSLMHNGMELACSVMCDPPPGVRETSQQYVYRIGFLAYTMCLRALCVLSTKWIVEVALDPLGAHFLGEALIWILYWFDFKSTVNTVFFCRIVPLLIAKFSEELKLRGNPAYAVGPGCYAKKEGGEAKNKTNKERVMAWTNRRGNYWFSLLKQSTIFVCSQFFLLHKGVKLSKDPSPLKRRVNLNDLAAEAQRGWELMYGLKKQSPNKDGELACSCCHRFFSRDSGELQPFRDHCNWQAAFEDEMGFEIFTEAYDEERMAAVLSSDYTETPEHIISKPAHLTIGLLFRSFLRFDLDKVGCSACARGARFIAAWTQDEICVEVLSKRSDAAKKAAAEEQQREQQQQQSTPSTSDDDDELSCDSSSSSSDGYSSAEEQGISLNY